MTVGKPANWKDRPLPRRVYCCAHDASCAVHQPPFDAKVVHCTCSQGTGLWRHPHRTPDPALVEGPKTVQ